MTARLRRCLLRLEPLESRLVPATITWINDSGGDWLDRTNWDLDRLPTSADDVVISLNDVVVTYDARRTTTVRSLTCTEKLEIESGKIDLLNASTIEDLDLLGGTLVARKGLNLTGDMLWTGGTLSGEASVDFRGTTIVTGSASKTLDRATFRNFGTWIWDEGRVRTAARAIFVNMAEGECRFDGGSRFDVSAENAGTWVIDTGATLDMVEMANDGDLFLASGKLRVGSFEQTSGRLFLSGGNLASGSKIVLAGGLLTGGGAIEATLLNSGGRIAPGGNRTLRITGDYIQGNDASLAMRLVGSVESALFDEIIVQGNAALAGRLELTVGAALEAYDLYPILTARSVAGQFVNMEPVRTGVYSLVPQNLPASVMVEARPIVPATNPPTKQTTIPTTTPTTSQSSNDVRTVVNGTTVVTANAASTLSSAATVSQLGRETVRTVGHQLELPGAHLAHSPVPGADVIGTVVTNGRPVGLGINGGGQRMEPALLGDTGSVTNRWGAMTPTMVAERAIAARVTESSGLVEELLTAFPLMLPELELPSESDVLVASDLARAQLVGGRSRADLLPQGGSQGAVIATLVTGDETARTAETSLSQLAHLFIDPMTLKSAVVSTPADVFALLDPEAAPEPEQAGLSPRDGIWLATVFGAVVAGGLVGAQQVRQRKLCSGPGKLPSRTSRQ